jgi:hypothetical protein
MSAVILSYQSLTRAPTSEVTASSRTSGEISTMTALAGRPPEDENSLIEWPADVRFLAHLLQFSRLPVHPQRLRHSVLIEDPRRVGRLSPVRHRPPGYSFAGLTSRPGPAMPL